MIYQQTYDDMAKRIVEAAALKEASIPWIPFARITGLVLFDGTWYVRGVQSIGVA